MIGLPYNDLECLEAISEVVRQLVEAQDRVLVDLAKQYPTTGALVQHMRQLPQRDDNGERRDGPRVQECTPTQRLRFGAQDPNCVERAALFIGVEELRDPGPIRQLATIDTEIGMHTLPLVYGHPVLLDPRVDAEMAELGLALAAPAPVALTPKQAIDCTVALAKTEAPPVRNGPSTVHRARNAIHRLIDDQSPDRHLVPSEVDAMGILLALAERAARRYGPRAVAIVQTTLRAIADVLAVATSQVQPRNMNFQIGDYHFDTPDWLDRFASAVHNTGQGIGKVAGRAYLSYLGISPDLVEYFGKNLEEQGLTDPLGNAPQLATFSGLVSKRSGAGTH
jgi:hypothetical protein